MAFTKYSNMTNAELLRYVSNMELSDPLILELVSRVPVSNTRPANRSLDSGPEAEMAAENLRKLVPQ